MTADIKPYPTYKDSGVPWLEQVPEHWAVKRAKTILRCINVRSLSGEEQLLTVSSERGVIPRSSATVTMFKAESYQGYKLGWPGDLVINSLWAWARGLGVSRYHGIISSAYSVYRPRTGYETYSSFIHELVRSTPFQWELQVRSKGIWISRLQLTDESFLNAPIPIPPPTDQAAIVRYLDHADGKVRHAISARQRLIKLLTEQKQAIIQHAVTRGLDPNVRLKPSGVPWLGDIPDHWGVDKIKHLARPGYKTFVDGDWIESPYITSDGIRLIQTGNIGIGTYREQGFRYVNGETFDSLSCTEVMPGDVLICRLGDPVGRACLAPRLGVRMITSVDVCILKPRADINPVFLVNVMTSRQYLGWVGSLVRGSTRDRVSRSMLGDFTLPIPPLSEQVAIVRYLDGATANLDKAIDAAHREIDLLREYRTRLIADVVTGKLDVRDVVVPDDETDVLPEELESIDNVEATDETDDVAETYSGSEETA